MAQKAIGIVFLLFLPFWVAAQDFILHACWESCPEDTTGQIDSAWVNQWAERFSAQASELSHSGFTYLWVPARWISGGEKFRRMGRQLRRDGLSVFAEITPSAAGSRSPTLPKLDLERWRDGAGVEGFYLNYPDTPATASLSEWLDSLGKKQRLPDLFGIHTPRQMETAAQADWINTTLNRISEDTRQQVDARVVDWSLREALRRATVDSTYDLRNIYRSSLRDTTTLSGYHILTLVNGPGYFNDNGIPGDADDRIENPLLAYAYLLTNNQIGLPVVFYGDYYGAQSGLPFYDGAPQLRDSIDQLIKAHREFIFNSTRLEYLNRRGTNKASVYLSGAAERSLIYQLDGANTPAGQAAEGEGRDVIVAVNFADTTLRLVQEINTANVHPGDRFTDVLNRSAEAHTAVDSSLEYGIANAIYIELPPRSYSVWVQGSAPDVLPGRIDFSVQLLEDMVELQWSVPDEAELRGYELQRSINGKQFEALHFLEAIGASRESASYLEMDDDIYPGETLYYRVRLIDKNGNFEHSPVEKIVIPDLSWNFEISKPQPGGPQQIRVKSNLETTLHLAVFNSEGEKVLSQSAKLQAGINETTIDLSDHPPGVYLITFTDQSGHSWTERIVHL